MEFLGKGLDADVTDRGVGKAPRVNNRDAWDFK